MLTGRRVLGAARRGKYLWLPLDSGDAVLAHLGMSGQMLVQPAAAPDERHLRVRFTLGARATDPTADDDLEPGSSTSGCSAASRSRPTAPTCPRRSPTSPATPWTRSSTRTQWWPPSGAGARASSGSCSTRPWSPGWATSTPTRRCGGLGCTATGPAAGSPAADVRRVLADVRAVMEAALREGGTSFDALYVNVNGESGYFDRSLHAYGQEGRPCERCGTPIVRVAFMNRSSYFCPTCQPRPRVRRISATGSGTKPS